MPLAVRRCERPRGTITGWHVPYCDAQHRGKGVAVLESPLPGPFLLPRKIPASGRRGCLGPGGPAAAGGLEVSLLVLVQLAAVVAEDVLVRRHQEARGPAGRVDDRLVRARLHHVDDPLDQLARGEVLLFIELAPVALGSTAELTLATEDAAGGSHQGERPPFKAESPRFDNWEWSSGAQFFAHCRGGWRCSKGGALPLRYGPNDVRLAGIMHLRWCPLAWGQSGGRRRWPQSPP